jgi:hypothetical protein
MKERHFASVMESYISYWFILQKDIQNLFSYVLPTIFALIDWRTKHLYPPFIVSHLKKIIFLQNIRMLNMIVSCSCCGRSIMNVPNNKLNLIQLKNNSSQLIWNYI